MVLVFVLSKRALRIPIRSSDRRDPCLAVKDNLNFCIALKTVMAVVALLAANFSWAQEHSISEPLKTLSTPIAWFATILTKRRGSWI